MPETAVDVRRFGAAGDGNTDDAPAIQAALDAGARIVDIPAGHYRVGAPLLIGDRTRLRAHPAAYLTLGDGACTTRHDALLRNRDPVNGNTDIAVEGGVWDGNCIGNPRPDGLFAEGYTGHCFRFLHVTRLRIASLTIQNPSGYYIALGEADQFSIDTVLFRTDHLRPNQDGVHLGGFCTRGEITNILALPPATNDDLIALNADDNVERLTNLGLKRGPIAQITIKNIAADDCYTFLRLLSVDQPIRDLTVDGVYGACRQYFLNADAARYCRTPLFDDAPGVTVGALENIRISDVRVRKSADNDAPLIVFETNAHQFAIDGFARLDAPDALSRAATLQLGKISDVSVTLDKADEAQITAEKADTQGFLQTGPERLGYQIVPDSRLQLARGGFDRFVIQRNEA